MSASIEGLDRAAAELRAGHAVIFPTDTVYGVGVAVRHAPGPKAICSLKRRDEGKPIAWLVGSVEDLQRYGTDVPVEAVELACRHWPGALTIVVKASDEVPSAFAANGTIGLRMPACDVALALIGEVGPIAASSANRAGVPAPGAFAALDPVLVGEAAFALEGEPGGRIAASGIASTVVDATGEAISVLRQGDIAV